jgi:hypothetical protein
VAQPTDYSEGRQTVGVLEAHPIHGQNCHTYVVSTATAGGYFRDFIKVFPTDPNGFTRKLVQRFFVPTVPTATREFYPESDVSDNPAFAAYVYKTYP